MILKKKILPLLMAFTLAFSGCAKSSSSSNPAVTTPQTTAPAVTEPAKTEQPKADSEVRVVAAGDNLIHSPIYNQAKARANGKGYDFDYAYQHVKGLIAPADLAILNQETPIANDIFEPSTYPQFNSPTALGDEMLKIGFDVISHSNNHILDKGEKGLLATLDYWDSRNTLVYGAYRDEDDLESIPTKEINGITFSFVGFMEHTNGLKLPKDATAKLVYTSDTETMEKLIKKASEISDVVVVSVHWGVEIQNEVIPAQKELAKKFVDWGADLIIGTQPHTVQTMEYLDKPDGGQAFVAYSLGNFISAQSFNLAMIGIVMDMVVKKDGETGEISITNIKAIPVITHYGARYSDVTAYPYNQYSDALAKVHGIHSMGGGSFNMQMIDTVLKENVPSEFLYLN